MFILAFTVSYAEVVLFAFLFFEDIELNTAGDIVDLMVCLIALIGGISLVLKAIQLVR